MNEIEQCKMWCKEIMEDFPSFKTEKQRELYDCVFHIYETLDDLCKPMIHARCKEDEETAAEWALFLLSSNFVEGKLQSEGELGARLCTKEHEYFLRGFKEGKKIRDDEETHRLAKKLQEWEEYLNMPPFED